MKIVAIGPSHLVAPKDVLEQRIFRPRAERIGIWGVSYGGFLTLAAITRYPEFFTCAVEAVGMPDLEALYRQTNIEGQSYLDRELGPLRGNLELYRQLSPLGDVAAMFGLGATH